jgi:hypothetical protein
LEIRSCELFVWAGLELWSFWSQCPGSWDWRCALWCLGASLWVLLPLGKLFWKYQIPCVSVSLPWTQMTQMGKLRLGRPSHGPRAHDLEAVGLFNNQAHTSFQLRVVAWAVFQTLLCLASKIISLKTERGNFLENKT